MKCLFIFILGLSFIFLSCAKKQTNIKTITFWSFGAEGENVQRLIKKFEDENPNIKVKVQQIPWTAAHEKLLTAFAGNSLPDVCQLGNTWIPEFTLINSLQPLDEFINKSNIVKPNNFFAGVWEMNTYNSNIMGIPWYVDVRLLFYRTDILESIGYDKAPQTWDELLKACELIKQRSNGEKYGIFLPTNEWQPIVLFALESRATILKDNECYAFFDDEKFISAFEFLREFYRKGYSPTSWIEVQNIYQGFAEGYIAMYITGPWNVGEFRKRLPDSIQNKWMTAPLPGKFSFPGVSLPGGSSLVIFKTSKNKEIAWKLIEFLTRPEIQVEFYKLTGDLPSNIYAWQDSLLKYDKHMNAFFIQLQNLRPTPKVAEWEQIAMKLIEFVELAAVTDIPTIKILNSLEKEVNRILEKRRWIVKHIAN